MTSGPEIRAAHETWHVIQQKPGRVRQTTSVGGVAVNDNTDLEHETDVMGARAASFGSNSNLLVACFVVLVNSGWCF